MIDSFKSYVEILDGLSPQFLYYSVFVILNKNHSLLKYSY